MTTRPILKAALPLAGALIAGCGQGTVQPEINELRAPAYPLVTIDPYTSAWSMYDNLYDGSIRHWTGKDFPLIGAIEVDGQTYRFMGTEDVEMLRLHSREAGKADMSPPDRPEAGSLRTMMIPDGLPVSVHSAPRSTSLRHGQTGLSSISL